MKTARALGTFSLRHELCILGLLGFFLALPFSSACSIKKHILGAILHGNEPETAGRLTFLLGNPGFKEATKQK